MSINFLEKNLQLFSKRFALLHKGLESLPNKTDLPNNIELFSAKNNEISATYEKSYLHSSYNPSAEAKKLMETIEVLQSDSIVFFGVGLGYGPIECALQHKNKTIIIVEPNPYFILLAFSTLDWSKVFEHNSLIFLLEAPQQTVITILEQYGLKECFFVAQKSIMQHAYDYFQNIQTLIERNLDKQSINLRTLEKFSTLWLSNMCKNFSNLEKLDGIQKYKDTASNLPACVLAAGPSLDEVLPHLLELKKRCIIICVDTALRACLSVGVEPHFILLVDPQYWNARHIEGLKCTESILITESAAYPSVFRFPCREIILCSSLFPLGKYAEKFFGKKGELAAGGSVATTAWDFARYIGCKKIIMAGLDLSFPSKKTHTKGSTFEEKAHVESKRTNTTETSLARVLYNDITERASDYEGNETITDARMKLYAWWFESKTTAYPHIETLGLSKKSLAIPNIQPTSIEKVLELTPLEASISDFINVQSQKNKTETTSNILNALYKDFSSLQDIVATGIAVCKKRYKTDIEYEKAIIKLNEVDSLISNSSAKDLASLVFPVPETLQRILQEKLPDAPPPPPKGTYKMAAEYNIQKSKVIYELIKKSIELHIRYLRKNA